MQRLFVPGQTNPRVMALLETFIPVCLVISGAVAVVEFTAWTVPAVASLLPASLWHLMKANTAVTVFLCTLSAALSFRDNDTRPPLPARLCTAAVVILTGGALLQHGTGIGAGLSTLFSEDTTSTHPGLMSIQTAMTFLLLGVVMFIGNRYRGTLRHVIDAIHVALIVMTFVFVAGYIYSAGHLVGQSTLIRMSPQTLTCAVLLTFVQTLLRNPFMLISALAGVGIGSQFARIMLPIAILASYSLIYLGNLQVQALGFSINTAEATTAVLMAVLLSVVIMTMARKINLLEADLRKASLTDVMTGLYNRRGFFLLAEQMLQNAQRMKTPLTVIFCDVDGLKTVNDTLGHETGSNMITDISAILHSVFRGNDVVGRIGGDEFAVISYGEKVALDTALNRLNLAINEANSTGEKPYQVSVSVGSVETNPFTDESLDDLLNRADEIMYRQKMEKKAGRNRGSQQVA